MGFIQSTEGWNRRMVEEGRIHWLFAWLQCVGTSIFFALSTPGFQAFMLKTINYTLALRPLRNATSIPRTPSYRHQIMEHLRLHNHMNQCHIYSVCLENPNTIFKLKTLIKRDKLPVTQKMSHRDEIHNMGNIVNNMVIVLYADKW